MEDCAHLMMHVSADERRFCRDCGLVFSVGHGKGREAVTAMPIRGTRHVACFTADGEMVSAYAPRKLR